MMTKRSKLFLATAVTLVLVTSLVPRGVYGIKNISLVREAEAQEGGGMGGVMQNLLPLLMMMMMMNMMNKNNGLQREQATAAQNANKNLLQAGSQSNGGAQPSVPNPLTPNGTNPINPGGVNIVIPLK